ncbi:MAG: DUF615 domain-containing protein [Betaproteobacteria bacterium]|nr:DUF615 domain-containing protein [Betaproteobacteria bacterium]
MRHAPPAADEADDAAEDTFSGPSKTQLKKAMLALQTLGVQLVELPGDRLKRVPLPERLRDAITQARHITAHGGRRRQIQYVGRLMRDLSDDELAHIHSALAAFTQTDAASVAAFHTLERWRSRLLDDDDALTQLLSAHPEADAQQLHTLIRNARKERDTQRPPAAFRELFQVLKGLELRD